MGGGGGGGRLRKSLLGRGGGGNDKSSSCLAGMGGDTEGGGEDAGGGEGTGGGEVPLEEFKMASASASDTRDDLRLAGLGLGSGG